jgi:E3 ubiquitin-protein ligase MARCH6
MGSNLTEREQGFRNAPGTSMFVHWLIGLTYVFYFASFVLLLKDILRPKLLWFLESINDPDFNPIQEMIHISVLSHTRKFFVSLVLFIFFITLMIYMPICVTEELFPEFLPYNINTTK